MTYSFAAAHKEWAEKGRDIAYRVSGEHKDAEALLVSGVWIDGPFRFIDGYWLSIDGIVVNSEDVRARKLGGSAKREWNSYLDDEPAKDCGNSLSPAFVTDYDAPRSDEDGSYPDHPAPIGDKAFCHECERQVPVVAGVAGEPVYARHDIRGRVLDDVDEPAA